MSDNTKFEPTIPMKKVGEIWEVTTEELGAKLTEKLQSAPFNIQEIDTIIITPRVQKNAVGASDLQVKAYFVVSPGGNIYKTGGGKGASENGRFNVMNMTNSSANGPFRANDTFKNVFGPLCRKDNNGNPIMNFSQVGGVSKCVAELELDYTAVLCLAMGVTNQSDFDFAVMAVIPLSDTNHRLVMAKLLSATTKVRGKSSDINYNRIAAASYRRINNGGNNNNNGGGRRY